MNPNSQIWAPAVKYIPVYDVNQSIVPIYRTATAGQRIFNLPDINYRPNTNSIWVYKNGVLMRKGETEDYLEADPMTVIFNTPLVGGEEITFVVFTQITLVSAEPFNTAIRYSVEQGEVAYLPPKSEMGGKFLSFDADGNPIAVVPSVDSVVGLTALLNGSSGSNNVGFIHQFFGSVPRTVQAKLRDIKSVLDFGAVGDGRDSTAAFQNAFNSGGTVYIPPGFYRTGPISIPAETKVFGAGRATQIAPLVGYSTQQWWTTANNHTGLSLGDIEFQVDVGTFPGVIPLFANPGDGAQFYNIFMEGGGNIGMYSINLTNSTIEHVTVTYAQEVGIIVAGGSNFNNHIKSCRVEGTANSHGISMEEGSYGKISDCYSNNAQGFGITMQRATHGKIYGNFVHNSRLEAITLGGDGATHGDAYGNICTWDPGVSEDFGMSIGANGNGGVFRIRYFDNIVRGAGKSGIAFASDSTAGWSVIQCEAFGNLIVDCNQLPFTTDSGVGAGVILYGGFCSGNLVRNNTMLSNSGNMRHGIWEVNLGGGGLAGNNNFFDNHITGNSLVKVNKGGTSTEAFCQDEKLAFQSWAPVISAGTGTITTSNVNAAYYYECEGRVDFHLNLSITNNGTGAQSVRFTLPFNAAFGAGNGRESGLSGKQINGEIAGNVVTIRTADNAYPGGTGAALQITGTFFRTF